MDRLERALEKSRRQRAALTPHPAESAESACAATDFTVDPMHGTLMESNRIVAHRARSAEADVYRQLRTQVLQIMNQSGFKALAITSPHYGDGKTTVALNLGISIALDLKQSVLLVDLDLRKPDLHRYLGVTPQVGLTDYLLNDTPLHDCLMRPPFERVSVLPAGSVMDRSSELLGAPKMIALAREMKARYPDRLVIYDMPPVLTQDDPIAFLPQIDAVLVVVRDGVTRQDDLKRCLTALAGANVIGTALNDCG
ncbi:MAG: CpsD/CapB family tyrosine-protein kinase [Alphaproteobacteria bacterium]|nr:CpsD/CapB family tyrosine-protein kinase [Alphaproteobacteria bacterium]